MHRRDDFHGAAGIEIEGNFWFDFSDEDELRSVNVESRTFDPFGTFASDFAEWLENAYPDIVVTTGFFDLPNAETMPIALDYVEEFVAQSPDYP